MLRDLLGDFGTLHQRRRTLKAFEAFWAKRPGESPTPATGLDASFQAQLDSWLRWHKGMLLAELVPTSLQYLLHDPLAPERFDFDHVLVDEYQDLNHGDQILIDLLAGDDHLLVVGDDDQSIYSVRWANPEGIRIFQHDRKAELLDCRRCPQAIVGMANSLIAKNPDRSKPVMNALPSNPAGEIHHVRFETMEDEAQGIASFVAASIADGRASPGECLILVNDRRVGHGIREAIRNLGVAAHSFFTQEPLETPDAQEAYLFLRLLAVPEDRVALRAWLGHGSTDGRRKSYKRAWDRADELRISVAELLVRMEAGSEQVPHTAALLDRWRILQQTLKELQPLAADTQSLIDVVLPGGHENLALLRDCALSCIDPWEEEGHEDLIAFVERIRGEIAQPEVPVDVDYVRIMSCHKSKGLTAHTVIVAGAIDGLIPRLPREDADLGLEEMAEQLHEQRRLFYVALTRTTNTLVLSSFQRVELGQAHRQGLPLGRKHWKSKTGTTLPSRFLQELGRDLPGAETGDDWFNSE
ncbi:MAG: ATP-dependent helicase [Lentisphaerae bacterium]|nr:ATP-dependent helicase [Lentisphaerota bacterium]